MDRTNGISTAVASLLALAAAFATAPAFAQAACQQWDLSGYWSFVQSNGTTPGVTLQQTGNQLHGNASYFYTTEHSAWVIGTVVDDHAADGPAVGTINGNSFELTIYWNNNSIGVYTGEVGPQGLIVGNTYDKNDPGTTAQWHSNRVATCSAAAAVAPPPAKPVMALGRIAPPMSGPTMTICDAARSARARNSPAAPGLERQCAAQAPAPGPPAPAPLPILDQAWQSEHAARGAELANQDPLAMELRDAIPEGKARNGFFYGMAVAEGQTANGPGKQAIRDELQSFDPDAVFGYERAVEFSVERNANADLAARGARIAAADPSVATARNAVDSLAQHRDYPDVSVFYKLGFDIATGLFGDPALGAIGNTATGPGSGKIRDSLADTVAKNGFDDAVSFHLARNYQH
jgi:hypothetical protein